MLVTPTDLFVFNNHLYIVQVNLNQLKIRHMVQYLILACILLYIFGTIYIMHDMRYTNPAPPSVKWLGIFWPISIPSILVFYFVLFIIRNVNSVTKPAKKSVKDFIYFVVICVCLGGLVNLFSYSDSPKIKHRISVPEGHEPVIYEVTDDYKQKDNCISFTCYKGGATNYITVCGNYTILY